MHLIRSALFFIFFPAMAGLLNEDHAGHPVPPQIQPYLHQLHQGDLIFRRGRSPESQAVLMADKECQYSHVGLVVWEEGQPYVIHAVPGENGKNPDYVKMERVPEFLAFRKAARYAVYRPDYDAEVREKAARTALEFYHRKLLFDDGYDLASDDKLYCTELVIKAFQQAGLHFSDIPATEINLFFARKKLILPGNIIENPHFFKIINN